MDSVCSKYLSRFHLEHSAAWLRGLGENAGRSIQQGPAGSPSQPAASTSGWVRDGRPASIAAVRVRDGRSAIVAAARVWVGRLQPAHIPWQWQMPQQLQLAESSQRT